MSRTSTAVWAFVALLTCASSLPAGEVRAIYERSVRPSAYDNSTEQRRFEQLMEPKHGVAEVGIERAPCFGSCPEYSLIVKADGTFVYKGIANVRRIGRRTGRVSDYEFNQLAELITESKYMELRSTYEGNVADLPEVYTTVVIQGRRKAIKNQGGLGPVRLWAIEQCIDGLLREAMWDGESPTAPPEF